MFNFTLRTSVCFFILFLFSVALNAQDITGDFVIKDYDGDGVCDTDDCAPSNGFIYWGAPCDDDNPCTILDAIDENCNCRGQLIAGCVPCLEGSPCNDGKDCTSGDHFDADCNCVGEAVVNCIGCELGAPCDDGDPCTSNDAIDTDCNCVGVAIENCLPCVAGASCDDSNPCTENDVFDANCLCQGEDVSEFEILQAPSNAPCPEQASSLLRTNRTFDHYIWYLDGRVIGYDREVIVSGLPDAIVEVFVQEGECTYQQSTTLEDHVSNTIAIEPSALTLCNSSESITLSIVPTLNNVQWYDSDGLIASDVHEYEAYYPDTYIVSATGPNGCNLYGEVTITGELYEKIDLIPENPYLCAGEPIELGILNAFPDANLEWFYEGVSLQRFSPVITVSEPGLYSVKVTDANNTCTLEEFRIVQSESDMDFETILLDNGFTELQNISITSFKGGDVSNNRSSSSCDLEESWVDGQNPNITFSIDGDPTEYDALEYFSNQLSDICGCDNTISGVITNGFCNTTYDFDAFLAFEETSSEDVYQVFISQDQERIFVKNSSDCLDRDYHLERDVFNDLVLDVLCSIKEGQDLLLEYDVSDTYFFAGSFYFFGEAVGVWSDAVVQNYKLGRSLNLTDISFIEEDILDEITIRPSRNKKSRKPCSITTGEFHQIKIPYYNPDCNGETEYLTITNLISGDRSLNDLVLKSPSELQGIIDGIVDQSIDNNVTTNLNSIPSCYIKTEDLCPLFTGPILSNKCEVCFLNVTSTERIEEALEMVTCFADNDLMVPYLDEVFNWFYEKPDFLGRMAYLFKHGRYNQATDVEDITLRLEEKPTFLSTNEYDVLGYTTNDFDINVKSKVETPAGGPYGHSTFDHFSENFQIDYFKNYVLYLDPHYSFHANDLEKDNLYADGRVSGLFIAYTLAEKKKTDTYKKIEYTIDAVSFFVGFGELAAALKIGRQALLRASLGLLEVSAATANIALNSSNVCESTDPVDIEFCKNYRIVLTVANMALLSGSVRQSIKESARRALIKSADEYSRMPQNVKSGFKSRNTSTVDILLLNIKTRFKDAFPDIYDLAIAQGKDDLFDQLADVDDVVDLLLFKNAISNNLDAAKGLAFFEDVVATKGVVDKLGGELRNFSEGWVGAWEKLFHNTILQAIRTNRTYLSSASKQIENYGSQIAFQFERTLPHIDAGDLDDFFLKLDSPKSIDHVKSLAGDFENIPGINLSTYVPNNLPNVDIPAPGTWADPLLYLPGNAAKTFTGSTAKILSPNQKIYRVLGEDQSSLGGYWTYELPSSKAELFGGTAVRPEWNSATHYVEYTVRSGGLKVWDGPTASQRILDEIDEVNLPGGDLQIYIPAPYRQVGTDFENLSKTPISL